MQRFVKALKTEIVANGDGKVRRAFQFPKFGMAWQCDTQHIMHITVGGVSKKIYCMQIIDDCTRMIVGGGIFFNDNTANFQIALKDAIFKYGIPQMIMVDYTEKETMPNQSLRRKKSPARRPFFSAIWYPMIVLDERIFVKCWALSAKVVRHSSWGSILLRAFEHQTTDDQEVKYNGCERTLQHALGGCT